MPAKSPLRAAGCPEACAGTVHAEGAWRLHSIPRRLGLCPWRRSCGCSPAGHYVSAGHPATFAPDGQATGRSPAGSASAASRRPIPPPGRRSRGIVYEETPASLPRQAVAVYFWCLADSHSPTVPWPRTSRLAASSSSVECGRFASFINFCSSHDGSGAKYSSTTLSFRERREVKHSATCYPLSLIVSGSPMIFKD